MGNSFKAQIKCDAITDFCVRLRFDNSNVTDKRNYSDGILEQYRQGWCIHPQPNDNAIFSIGTSVIELGASWLKIHLASGASLETIGKGIGFNGEKFLLSFEVDHASAFYGFGERTKALNKRGDRMDFGTSI